MTPLVYWRLGDHAPPDREHLAVDAGASFRAWRSNAAVVGRFAGTLPGPLAAALEEALAETTGAAAPELAAEPDAGTESVEVAGTEVEVPAGADPGEPWAAVLVACRAAVDAVLDQPLAAVALSVDLGAGRVRLEHRGAEVLPVELGAARVTVGTWRGGAMLTEVRAEAFGLGHVDAGPGWTAETTLPSLPVQAGDRVSVEVRFVAVDDGVFVPVDLLVEQPAA